MQKKYKIAVVPTIIIFDDGEEVKRFQADLSFKIQATRKEIQDYIDELIISKF
jgi:thiol-disulfide isomerase/thioredoxin